MRKIITLIATVVVLCIGSGCNSWKRTLCSQGNWEDMVRNCITDFLHTSLASKDSVFYIFDFHKDSMKRKYSTLLIGSEDDKIYAFPQDTVGARGCPRFPTRYLIVDNKLFIWNDPNLPITQELISVYERYNLIDREWLIEELEIDSSELTPDLDLKGYNILPPYKGNEDSKGAWYYIDKSDFTKYKRFIQSYKPNYNP